MVQTPSSASLMASTCILIWESFSSPKLTVSVSPAAVCSARRLRDLGCKIPLLAVISLPTALPGTADACCAAARSSLGFICSTLSGREHALKAVRLLGKIAGALDRHGLGALLRLGGERGDLRLELGDAALHARGVVRRHAAAQHEWLQLGHHIVGLRQITAAVSAASSPRAFSMASSVWVVSSPAVPEAA